MRGAAVAFVALTCTLVAPRAATASAPEIASIAFEEGRYDDALAAVAAGLAALPEGARAERSELLTLRGLVLGDRGAFGEAEASLDAALRVLTRTSNVAALVDNLVARGLLAHRRGQNGAARSYYGEAQRWLGALDDSGVHPALTLARARLALATGSPEGAPEGAAVLRRACGPDGDARCHAEADLVSGRLALARGDLRGALRLLLGAEETFRTRGLARSRLQALVGLVEAYRRLGRTDQATAAADVGLTLAGQVGHRVGAATLGRHRGELALAAGEREAAEQHLVAALEAYTEMAALPGIAGSRLVLGELAARDERWPEARTQLTGAYEAYGRLDDREGRRDAARWLATAARAAGDTEAEERWLMASVSIGRDPAREWPAWKRLGALALERGDRREAVDRLTRAMDAVEVLGAVGAPNESREAFRQARLDGYDLLVEAWLSGAGATSPAAVISAVEVSERSVARAFLDLIERARLRRSRPEVDAVLDEMDALDARIRALSEDGLASARVVALGQERSALEERLRSLAPDLPGLAPARLKGRVSRAVRALFAGLRPDVAVLKYHLAPSRSYLFVIRRQGTTVVPLAGRELLGPLASRFHETLARPVRSDAERRQLDDLGRDLFDKLVRPAQPWLRGLDRVVVVPHAELRVVAFDALVVGQQPEDADLRGPRYAIERFAITYAPSLTGLAELNRDAIERRKRDDRHPLVAFADPIYDAEAPIALPRLAWSTREAEVARGHLGAGDDPGTLFLRAAATESNLKQLALSRYRIVHFATHGYAGDLVDDQHMPSLFFGRGDNEDGVLRLDEVLDLRLDADLVVLSACDSGHGPLQRGDGLGGLTGAFLYAGASSVMATLWAVEDAHAAQLMDVFYGGIGHGQASSSALRGARLALLAMPADMAAPRLRGIGGILDANAKTRRRASPRRALKPVASDPFFWASFVLVGDSADILR